MLPKYYARLNKGLSLALLFTDFFFLAGRKLVKSQQTLEFSGKSWCLFSCTLKSQCDKNISTETFTFLSWRQLGTFQTFWDLRLALVSGDSFLNAKRFFMVAVCAIYLSCTGRRGHCPFHPLNWFCMAFTWSGIGIGIVILKNYIKLYEVKQMNSMFHYFLIKIKCHESKNIV